MSELKVDKVSPRSGTYLAVGTLSYKNILINGDMSIAQRSTSVASITGSGYYTVDRMNLALISLGTWTQSQSTDVPTGQGFATSLKMDCTTADAAPSASDQVIIQQRIEGQNLQYLKKGTANAESLTLSFWVKSNKTGTYVVNILDNDNSRQISNSYTINASNTWEKKTLTFAGDTTGVFGNDNNLSIELNFWLGAGSTYTSGTLQTSWTSTANADLAVGQVNLADNTANEFYITGVQLEAGTTASDFEFLPVDVNLGRCYRYFQKHFKSNSEAILGGFRSTSVVHYPLKFFTTMRTTPSFSVLGLTANNLTDGSNTTVSDATQQNAGTCNDTIWLAGTMTSSAGTVGGTAVVYGANGLEVSSEL
jgi:hypothetical protein